MMLIGAKPPLHSNKQASIHNQSDPAHSISPDRSIGYGRDCFRTQLSLRLPVSEVAESANIPSDPYRDSAKEKDTNEEKTAIDEFFNIEPDSREESSSCSPVKYLRPKNIVE